MLSRLLFRPISLSRRIHSSRLTANIVENNTKAPAQKVFIQEVDWLVSYLLTHLLTHSLIDH